MKIQYSFVGETIEIEVSGKWGEILIGIDHEEYNNDRNETLRYYHLVGCTYEGEDSAVKNKRISGLFEDYAIMVALSNALSQLQPQQRKLLRRIYSISDREYVIAREQGVSKAELTRRLNRTLILILGNSVVALSVTEMPDGGVAGKLNYAASRCRRGYTHLADSLQTMRNAIAGDNAALDPQAPVAVALMINKITLEQVRAVLIKKNHDGFTKQIRGLLQKYWAQKLSAIDPDRHADLMRDAEEHTDAGK